MSNGRGKRYGYVMGVLVALDQLAHAAFGGDPDETISSALGKRKVANGGRLRWRDWWGVAKPLDWVLHKLDPHHSLRAIEGGVGEKPKPPKWQELERR